MNSGYVFITASAAYVLGNGVRVGIGASMVGRGTGCIVLVFSLGEDKGCCRYKIEGVLLALGTVQQDLTCLARGF